MIKIFIADKSIYIRNFLIKDINKEYLNWFSGKNEDLKFSRHYHKKYSRSLLIKNYKDIVSSKNLFLGIFQKGDGILIGTIIIYINRKEKTGNLGILIGDQNNKSKGYALKSCKMLINYLIRNKIVNSIISGTKLNNLKMINLMKNLKMRKIGKKDSKHVNYIFKKNL